MERRRFVIAVSLVSAAALMALSAFDAGAAGGDELEAEQDNPPDCATATAESSEQCGAQGRDHFAAPDHRPPIEACSDVRSDTGSVVTRLLPSGPVRDDGSLAFVPGICVYLPPGYADSGLRYPVVYLLHGGGGDQADWVTFGGVQEILDEAYGRDAANAVIAVMPDGRSGQWFDYYDGSFLNETYVLDHLIPFVDRHLRTIADRRGRAIAGLSNGGYGALHFAAKAPDLFVAAGSMSGNLGARSMGGLGTPVAPGGPAFQEAGAYYYGNIPVSLIPNLDPVDLVIDWGATCSSDATVDACGTWGAEQAFRLDNQEFRNQLEALEYAGTYDYRETEGAHAWRWWTTWLREHQLPFFLDRLSAAEPDHGPVEASTAPGRFRFRSIAASFDVFGYEVAVDRPVREFLDLRDVTAGGFVVSGSGSAVVTTAARYRPGQSYDLSGTGLPDSRVRADGEGRLRIEVDLGPAHEYEQYSPPARAQEAAGGYWVERTVVIADEDGETVGNTAVLGATATTAPGTGGRRAGDAPASAAQAPMSPDEVRIGNAPTERMITQAAASSPSVPAASFLVLLLLVGAAVGAAARARIQLLRTLDPRLAVILGVTGSVLGGVLGYVTLGFDFEAGAVQIPGVIGSVAGAVGALAVYAVRASAIRGEA